MITAADKLHNLTALVRAVRAHGVTTLQRFDEPDKLVWYYRSVNDALEPHRRHVPLSELEAALADLRDLLAPSESDR